MNYGGLKKQTFIETGIIAAVVMVLTAVVFLLASIRDDYVDNNQTAKRMLSTIEGEYNQILSKYSFIQQNADLYELVRQKQEDGSLSINRQSILERFNQYKSQYQFTNLRLSVSPIEDVNQPEYQKPTHKITSSEVSIQLEALSDERVYEMLDSMRNDLSGFPRVSRITIIREKGLAKDVLATLRRKGYFPLIRSGIKFTWYSINVLESPDNAGR